MNTSAYVREFSLKQARETVAKDQRTGQLVTLVVITGEQWAECYPQIELLPAMPPFGQSVVISTTWLVRNLTDDPEFQAWYAAQLEPNDIDFAYQLTMPVDRQFGLGDYEPCVPL